MFQIILVMANTHSIEEQVSMAKEMLFLQDSKRKEEAVSILIDISKQGHREATYILKKMFGSKRGNHARE